jgi:hypothetical protein
MFVNLQGILPSIGMGGDSPLRGEVPQEVGTLPDVEDLLLHIGQ